MSCITNSLSSFIAHCALLHHIHAPSFVLSFTYYDIMYYRFDPIQQTRFNDMGNSILGRMDEMGKRMDELESNIGGLMTQAGLEPPNGNGAGVTPPPLNPRGTMHGTTKTSASGENKPKSISQRTSSSSSSVEI
jgi:hypothetical protein